MEKSPRLKTRSRLAPTPSGYLHLGNGVNFIITWLMTRHLGGDLYLRIDDVDATRSRPEFIEDIFQSLNWLQIDFDFGPGSPDEFTKNFSQQDKTEYYRTFLNKLKAYACQCSRKEIQNSSSNGVYPGTCRLKNHPYVKDRTSLRLKVSEKSPLKEEMGDFIIWRKDDLPSYQLTSLVEDEENKINLIIRGEDLKSSSMAQKYLAQELNSKNFQETRIIHHKLILDDKGYKLSKSQGAYSLKQLRESGQSPLIVYKEVAKLLSLSFEKVKSLQDLQEIYADNPYSL